MPEALADFLAVVGGEVVEGEGEEGFHLGVMVRVVAEGGGEVGEGLGRLEAWGGDVSSSSCRGVAR